MATVVTDDYGNPLELGGDDTPQITTETSGGYNENVFDPTYGGTMPTGQGPGFGSYDPYDAKFGRPVGEGVGNLGNMGGEGSPTIPTINLSDNSGTIKQVGDWFSKLLTGQGSVADYGTVLTGLMGLYEYMNRDRSPKSWEGKVQKGTYVPPTVSPEYTKNVVSRGYGKPAMGMNPFTGGRYIAPPAAPTPLAKGGALPPRYLRGETDGMADKLPSSIDGRQPAKLSHGEFVIPADVVSHLGNGNSDAGAKVLYKMMDRVRQARTGTKRQGKQIKPEKFMPGGIANIPRYAGGGAVAFNNGGTATAGTTAGGLAPWVGDYVAGPQGFLSKAWALGDQPYQAYQGPLTAGVSPLQEQAFTMAQNLGTPGQFGTATQMATQAGQAAGTTSFTPGTFNTGLGPVGSVQSYMSPYMQSVVDIQAREARRQADIGRQSEQARLAQAGAYGGSRQAIMEAERQRNLGQQIGDIQEKGLQSAYDRAMEQRFKEAGLGMDAQRAGEQSRQFGAGLGLQGLQQQLSAAQTLGGLGQQAFGTQLQGLDALSRAGATQQQAEQASVDAQLRQFQEAQQWPYKQLEFQRGLLSGLPVGTQTVTPTTSVFSDLIGGIGDLLGLYEQFGKIKTT